MKIQCVVLILEAILIIVIKALYWKYVLQFVYSRRMGSKLTIGILITSLVDVLLVTSPVFGTTEDTCYSLSGFTEHVWRCSPEYVPDRNITGEVLLGWATAYCSQLARMMSCIDQELDYCLRGYQNQLKAIVREKGSFCKDRQPLEWVVTYATAKMDRQLLSLACIKSIFFTTAENLCRRETASLMLLLSEEHPVLMGISEARILFFSNLLNLTKSR